MVVARGSPMCPVKTTFAAKLFFPADPLLEYPRRSPSSLPRLLSESPRRTRPQLHLHPEPIWNLWTLSQTRETDVERGSESFPEPFESAGSAADPGPPAILSARPAPDSRKPEPPRRRAPPGSRRRSWASASSRRPPRARVRARPPRGRPPREASEATNALCSYEGTYGTLLPHDAS